ncbi:LysR family transcriptional regulator [Roseovarius faecimaris]|uniref:LysR family transcriptional regulator n=1 Tax=Roseovarius faecimaris TaxID=2494550 RepID=A0A6I6ISG7_9RHOB|nr:LysR substrate-binding domain-containing protein [Roseovarius faecimaris]QGX99645.1 LysR family transcriptional regulator [Roseovarius faecimaris]
MRHSQLRAFHHVALHGGFSRAAEALHQTQPALSDQVRKLEQAHDTLLFHRDRREVRLTEAGEGLFRLTRQYFEQEGAIADYLSQSRASVHGTLRIIADSALHVTDALRRFQAAHPRVSVLLQTGNTAEVLAQLRNYDAEVGVVGNLDPAPDLIPRELSRSPIIAIAAKGLLPRGVTSLTLAELRDWPLVFRESGSHTRLALEEEAARRRLPLRPTITVDGREAMREVVASGTGLGFVSEAEFGQDRRLVKVPITDLNAEMTETLVHLGMRADVPVIRAFLRSVEEG